MNFIKKHIIVIKSILAGLFFIIIILSSNLIDAAHAKPSFSDTTTTGANLADGDIDREGSTINHSLRVWDGTSFAPDITSSETYLPIITNTPRTQKLGFLFEGNIWTVKDDGTILNKITNNGNISAFSWSPDGERFAFIVKYDDSFGDIYTLNADGTNMQKLTSNARASHLAIDWHGSKIALLRYVGDYPYVRIAYVEMNDPTHPIVDISPTLENWGMGRDLIYSGNYLRWSPNGQWIVLSHGSADGIASSDGNVFIDERVSYPHWKNDSSHIISPRYPAGIYYYNPNDSSTGDISQVSNHVAVYSPDDQFIIYCDDYALWRMKPDNTQHTMLVYVKSAHPDWSPEGDKIAYVSWVINDDFGYNEPTGIHIINSDGTEPVHVMSGWISNPRWQP